MTTERERIDRMLAEGKVSAEEAKRLRAALDASEREEAQAPAGTGEEIRGPKLSRLALAGALGMPAAVVAFLVLTGLGLVLGVRDDNAVAGGLLVAAGVVLVGVGMSIAGLVVTRQSPDRLSGRRLALTGIVVPVALTILGGIASAITWHHFRKRAEAMEREWARAAKEEALRRREEAGRREEARRREKERRAAREIALGVHSRFRSLVGLGRPAEFPLRLELLEPGWAEDYRAGRITEEEKRDTVLDEAFIFATGGGWSTNAEISAEADKGYVVMEGSHHSIRVPVKKVGGEWYLAREKIEYRFARGSTARVRIEMARARLKEIRDAWARFSALIVSGDARAEELHEFLHPRLLKRIREGAVSREDLRGTILSDTVAELLKRRKQDTASFWETTIRLGSNGDDTGNLVVTNGDAYALVMLTKVDGRWRFEHPRLRLPTVRTPADAATERPGENRAPIPDRR